MSTDPAAAERLREEGNNAFKRGDYGAAIKYYKAAIDENRDDPRPHRNLASAYIKISEDNLAMKEFETCIKISPGADPYDYFNLGQLRFNTLGGQFQALMNLNEFVRLAGTPNLAGTRQIAPRHVELANRMLEDLNSRSYDKREDAAPGFSPSFSRPQGKLSIKNGRLYLDLDEP